MKILNNKGTTFIEIISSTLILLFIFQLIFNLFIISKNFKEENFFDGEYRRQLHFAESYLKRDFFESVSGRKAGTNQLELSLHSGEIITYYLGEDPYGDESWKGKSSKTLYRKVSGENAQPLTQYCDVFTVEELWKENYLVLKAELFGGKKKLKAEGYYDKN